MPLSVLSPLLLWLALFFIAPGHPWLHVFAEPLTVYAVMGVVAVLAALMRQWLWWYWLALAAATCLSLQLHLLLPRSAEQQAALLLFLPTVLSLLSVLLVLLKKPPLWTLRGISWLALLMAAPLLLPHLPLTSWHQGLSLPLDQPFSTSLPVSRLLLFLLGGMALLWFVLLPRLPRKPLYWGQFGCWSLLMLALICVQLPLLSHAAMIAAALCIVLALALQMLHLAYIDELTQLPQRRALLGDLRHLGKRSAVTMLDVDHFKKFNDTYGHDVGDQVLRLLGAIFAREPGFRAYRYGGEEFTLVFSHNDPEQIEEALESVRRKVAAYPLRLRSAQRPGKLKNAQAQRGRNSGKSVRVTISLGCALRRPGESSEALLKRADTLLYRAKKAGRNRVHVAS